MSATVESSLRESLLAELGNSHAEIATLQAQISSYQTRLRELSDRVNNRLLPQLNRLPKVEQ